MPSEHGEKCASMRLKGTVTLTDFLEVPLIDMLAKSPACRGG